MEKIVDFPNGTFGVMRGDKVKEFLAVKRDFWWRYPAFVAKYCHFKTENEARAAAEGLPNPDSEVIYREVD